MLFRGERKGEQPRATERAGVSGKEARGGADNERQLKASRAHRRPALATGGHALWPVGHVRVRHDVLQCSIRSLTAKFQDANSLDPERFSERC